ncbi:MAG: D-TA family PLP-dependent enzyme [Verrucomicrobiota bacterium]
MSWHLIKNVNDVPSPALLVYPDRIQENVRRMIAMTGGTERLRPHIKTHKMAEVMRIQLDAGITKYKCATIAEAEMAAGAGAPDMLLAYQPVGPNVSRFLALIRQFPKTKFSTVVDDESAIRALSHAAGHAGISFEVFVDIDCGMHRTGIPAGVTATALYHLVNELPGLKPGGLHAYDGHNHASDVATRTEQCTAYMSSVRGLRDELLKAGLPVPRVVASGTPTFPLHAKAGDVECSPGTTVLWDAGYGNKFKDLDFLHAALVLTRVISRPGLNRLCLDLGHKAIAPENPHPRVYFIGLPDVKFISQSEEHLVIETDRAGEFQIGDALYGIPHHICPTVALHGQAVVIENGQATARWEVTARERIITI